MRTIRQIAELTGISVRTLQYYDEIDLLKPSKVTAAGYRFYNNDALEKLQQILFFRELDFRLKEIKTILENPAFNKVEAYRKQKQLLCLKRSRIDKLIQLLDKLEKGETCMSFNEFDLQEYVAELEKFKQNRTDEVIKYWGSVDQFDAFIEKIKTSKSAAALAVKQYGSIHKYTEAMKYNLTHFSEYMEYYQSLSGQADKLAKESEDRYLRLTSDLTKDPASKDIQAIVLEIIQVTLETSKMDMAEGYWALVADGFSKDPVKTALDQKLGIGSADYLVKAFQYYLQNNN